MSWLRFAALVSALSTAVFAAGCSGSSPTPAPSAARASTIAGKSIVVLGHSGATGYNSDPNDTSRDAGENSWATGTNPAVNSVYLRLLGTDPAYQRHNYNLAKDGATVDDLGGQTARLETVKPTPGVILIQVVDNDIKCDGTDARNYAPFADKLATVLQTVARYAPAAHIYVLSMWATAQAYTDAVSKVATARDSHTGTGPCDLLDGSGTIRHQAVLYQQDVMDHYHQQLARVCATVPTCKYDNGALQKYPLVTADLTPDGNHLTVAGQQKYADLVWKTFFAT
jgi:lysophospholipase L1-like esterase